MAAELTGLVGAAGVIAFTAAAVLALHNYRRTAGITNYWLFIVAASIAGIGVSLCGTGQVTVGCMGLGDHRIVYGAFMVSMLSLAGVNALRNRFSHAVM